MSTGMWKATRRRLGSLGAEAAAQGRCMLARTAAEQRALDAGLARGMLCSPFPGLYAPVAAWDVLPLRERSLRVLRGAGALHPSWVFCGQSAAVAHGLEVSGAAPGVVQIVGSSNAAQADGHVRLHRLGEVEAVVSSGVACTCLGRTVADCLRWMDLPHGLAVSDSTLRLTGWGRESLLDLYRDNAHGRRGCVHGAEAVLWADPRAENGGESVARGVMIELGFDVPDLQVEVDDPTRPGGRFRVDFCWHKDGRRPVFGELDGQEKYASPYMNAGHGPVEKLRQERLRESRLTLQDAAVLRFRFSDLRNREGFRALLETFGIPYRRPDAPPPPIKPADIFPSRGMASRTDV